MPAVPPASPPPPPPPPNLPQVCPLGHAGPETVSHSWLLPAAHDAAHDVVKLKPASKLAVAQQTWPLPQLVAVHAWLIVNGVVPDGQALALAAHTNPAPPSPPPAPPASPPPPNPPTQHWGVGLAQLQKPPSPPPEPDPLLDAVPELLPELPELLPPELDPPPPSDGPPLEELPHAAPSATPPAVTRSVAKIRRAFISLDPPERKRRRRRYDRIKRNTMAFATSMSQETHTRVARCLPSAWLALAASAGLLACGGGEPGATSPEAAPAEAAADGDVPLSPRAARQSPWNMPQSGTSPNPAALTPMRFKIVQPSRLNTWVPPVSITRPPTGSAPPARPMSTMGTFCWL